MTTVMHLPLADNRDDMVEPGALTGAGAGGIESDALYAQLLQHMQQGCWADAADLLAGLEARYPGAIELVNVRLSLALHLSAEESWSGKAGRAASGLSLPMPLIRTLAVADLVLYALIIVMLYLSRSGV